MTRAATIHAQQKWEYFELTRKTEAFLQNELNDLGQQAWELVSITHLKDRKGEFVWTAFLKRPFVGHPGSPSHGVTHAAEPALHVPEQQVRKPPPGLHAKSLVPEEKPQPQEESPAK